IAAAVRFQRGVHFGGRLSSSHRVEHLGERGWFAAAAAQHRAVSSGVLYPTRAALADALRRVLATGVELDGAADHGVSEALYLRDPDGNGVELYWDRPKEKWPHTPAGELAMFTHMPVLGGLINYARSFTAFSEAPFLNASGAAAFEMSPPSRVMPACAAPSTCRKMDAGFSSFVALNKTSCDSMKRKTDSASLSPCTLKPFTDASRSEEHT